MYLDCFSNVLLLFQIKLQFTSNSEQQTGRRFVRHAPRHQPISVLHFSAPHQRGITATRRPTDAQFEPQQQQADRVTWFVGKAIRGFPWNGEWRRERRGRNFQIAAAAEPVRNPPAEKRLKHSVTGISLCWSYLLNSSFFATRLPISIESVAFQGIFFQNWDSEQILICESVQFVVDLLNFPHLEISSRSKVFSEVCWVKL